jgi:hypothetical protein
MKTAEKINLYSQLIQYIDYDNREGGKYAYIQYMSYVREIVALLSNVRGFDDELFYLEKTSARFNEFLCDSFGDEQRLFFHESRMRSLLLLQGIKSQLNACEVVGEDHHWLRNAG